MRKPFATAPALLLAASLPVALPPPAGAAGGYAVYETQAPFDDTLDALKLAIEERGMYINNVMHLGEMLERTGKDLGDARRIYERAESVEFCSATLSRAMTAEDPARLVNCPFIVSVYTLPDRPGTTLVVHREVPQDQVDSSPTMRKVAEMLKGVAGAAAAW
jgi:uncharacterized protein (DUF302 family)